jgi:hypothetical protein
MLKILGIFFIVLGGLGWFGSFIISFKSISISKELPWNDVGNIIVDNKGNIYLSLQAYGRIQSYDKRGIFQKQWPITCGGGGNFRIKLDEQQKIMVATAKDKCLAIFDINGVLINQISDSNLYSAFAQESEDTFVTKNNEEYSIVNVTLIPRIIKKTKDNSQQTIVSMPWYFLLFKNMFSLFVLFIIGFLLIKYAK